MVHSLIGLMVLHYIALTARKKGHPFAITAGCREESGHGTHECARP